MGLFDKIKNKVAQVTQQPPQEQQQQQHQQPQYADHSAQGEETEEIDEDTDDSDAEVDDWGGWDPNDWNGYWLRLKAIEQAGNENGDDACDAKCREFGLADYSHMQRVRDTFHRHFGERHEFTQAALQATMQQQRGVIEAAGAANSAIFEPVEGCDLQLYASTQAQAATIGNDMSKWGQILAAAGFDQAKWERVSTEWNRRMSGQAGDMNATMALLTEYGKCFGQAGQGQYGAAAAANAGAAGMLNDGSGAVGAEPCSLERYAEIGGAQSAWAQQGRDVNAMLAQQFGMNALDWSNISQYWSAKFQSDYRIAGRYGDLSDHYTKQYMAAGGGAPADQDSDIDI